MGKAFRGVQIAAGHRRKKSFWPGDGLRWPGWKADAWREARQEASISTGIPSGLTRTGGPSWCLTKWREGHIVIRKIDLFERR